MCMDEAIVKRSKLYYLNIGKMSHIDELYYIAYLLTRTRETDNIVRGARKATFDCVCRIFLGCTFTRFECYT